MDSTATFAVVLDWRRDRVAARDAATDLIGWLDVGGFPPAGYDVATARRSAVSIRRLCA